MKGGVESKGRKDQRNWYWYTWKILQELGKVDWKVEYKGVVKEQLRHENYLDCTEKWCK